MPTPALANIPLWNLLEEFFLLRTTLESPIFRAQLANAGVTPIKMPLFDWRGFADDLLTVIVQRSILGVECYVSGAVWFEVGGSQPMTPELDELIRNPFNLPGRGGTARSFYHKLPSLVPGTPSLVESDPDLWCRVQHFYRSVRNPIFHGMQFDRANANDVAEQLSLIQEIYDWIRTWHEGDYDAAKRRFLLLPINHGVA